MVNWLFTLGFPVQTNIDGSFLVVFVKGNIAYLLMHVHSILTCALLCYAMYGYA